MTLEIRGLGSPTSPGIERPVQSLKQSRSLTLKRNCTIRVAKTKSLISCAVTAQLICAFVFAKAKIRFSRDATQMTVLFEFQTTCNVNLLHIPFECIITFIELCRSPMRWLLLIYFSMNNFISRLSKFIISNLISDTE